jgi:response regulator RpfG family c-di-GMP phosphodiesterase
VAASKHALLSDAPFRPALTMQTIRVYLQEQSGILFDPAVMKAF